MFCTKSTKAYDHQCGFSKTYLENMNCKNQTWIQFIFQTMQCNFIQKLNQVFKIILKMCTLGNIVLKKKK